MSSKQPQRKPKPGIPATNGTGKSNSRAAAGGTQATTKVAPRTATKSATGGPGTRPVAKNRKSGFRLRPLDIALIVLGVVVIGAIVWGSLSNAQSGPQINTASPTGQQAPDVSAPDTHNNTVKISDFRGKKTVLVEFMAPWCPHCQDDTPILNKLWDAYKDKGIQFLGISATPFGRNYESGDNSPITMDDMIWFRDQFKVQYPLLFDKDLKGATAYAVEAYPTFFVVDKDGKISDKPPYPITYESVASVLDKYVTK